MNLTDQVVNLELSKKLKELGVEKDSLFYWEELDELSELNYFPNGPQVNFVNELLILNGRMKFYEAYTASELLEFFPQFINSWIFRLEKYPSEYEIKYSDEHDTKRLCVGWDKNISNALAKMLIHLIENKIIEV